MVKRAIILAAGYGSRLQERSASKPLTLINGISLIEIGVRQLMAAGVDHIVVVTGHEAASVERHVAALSEQFKIAIEAVRLDDWSKPNGWSVIAGAALMEGPFLLVMADHVFGDAILPMLARQSLAGRGAVLATDQVDNPLVDPEDATWVAIDNHGMIERIGKSINPYDVVDCGAFLANEKLPQAIEQAIAAGKPGSLSDGMQMLADARRAGTVDIAGEWWIDVDDPRALDLAQEQVVQHLAIFAATENDPAAKDSSNAL